MKIRKFNEKVVVPNADKFNIISEVKDKFKKGEIKDLQELNELTVPQGFKFIKHSEFSELMKDVKDVAETMPKKGDRQMIPHVLWFMIMNKKTNLINIVLDDNFDNNFKLHMNKLLDFPVLVSILKHEDIHRQQIERMGDSKYYIVRDPNDRKKYFSDPNEIMAFAYSIIEDLKNDGFSRDEILNKLKDGDLSFSMGRMMTGGRSSFHPIYFDYVENLEKNSKEFKKLQKYMYLYTIELFDKDKTEKNVHDKINLNDEMSKIKKFEAFVESVTVANQPQTAPTKPGVKPADPGTKPQKPNPRRRIKPSVDPRPKAEAEDLINNLIDKFDDEATTSVKKEIIEYYGKKNR
jgi:hypothetical protein